MFKSAPIKATNHNSEKYDRKMIKRRFGKSAALMRQIIENYKIFSNKNLQNRCFQCFLTSLPTSSMDKMGYK